MIIAYLTALNKVKNFTRTIVYDFLDDSIIFEIYRKEEKIENGKIYYQDLVSYKVSKNYIYLKLQNNTWLAINKEEGLLDFIQSKGIKPQKLFTRR